MTARPRDIGTAAESAVVRAMRPWFPQVERRALRGTLDCGDLTGCPGLVVEVKGGAAAASASDGQVALWLAETERERSNAGADVGLLVLKRKGVGPKAANRWWAVLTLGTVTDGKAAPRLVDLPVRMHLDHACQILASLGYGEERTL